MSLENSPDFLLNFSEFEMNGKEKHFYQFKSFRLDVEERQLLNNNETVSLTPKVFDVLAVLVERNGHLVEKDELLRVVWSDSFVEEANVARIVHTLRKVLGEDDHGNKLKNNENQQNSPAFDGDGRRQFFGRLSIECDCR
jgi:DNA-binding response OmpR family regulator